jgi:hypothetical protein
MKSSVRTLIVLLLFISILSLLFSSCKKDRKTNWDTELLLPLVNTNLSLSNLVKDSVVKTNSDNSLTLAYSSELYNFNLAEQVINIPDTSIGQKFNITNLILGNQRVRIKVSLGTLATNMLSSPDGATQFLGQYLIAQNGNMVVLPPVSGLNPGAFPFDATAYFDSAILYSGVVKVWAINHLPVPLNGAVCNLTNVGDGSLVATYNMPGVASYDSSYFEIPITGVKLTNKMNFSVVNLSTPGSNNVPVLIDTSDYIELDIFATELRAQEAWAKFPTQNVVEITEDVTQIIGDRKFTYIDARRGLLHVFVTSSVEEQLYLEYTLVGAYDDFGKPLKLYTTVPAAPVGGTVTIDDSIDITGYSINLTGKDGTKFNTYTQKVIARIDSSGITRHITASDSLLVRYELKNIAPNYIKGYAGRDTINAIDTADFAFLDIFKSGTIDLEDVKMNFSIENGIGVDGQVKINSFKAISANNGSKTLTGSIVGQPLTINRATDFPLTPAINNFLIDNSNSNIKELLGILPNKIEYDVQVKTNVNGNNLQYRDFAYLESALKVKLNAEIPLSLIANNLVLLDTIGFDLSQTNTNVAGIRDGVINLIAKNKYPIEANVTMIIYDENWNAVDTLASNQIVAAADLNNNCKAEESKRTKVPLYVDEVRMEKVKTGRHAVIRADFSTKSSNATCNGQYLKIYSDYNLDITFTARFNYEVNADF